jgi:hypothetical protein
MAQAQRFFGALTCIGLGYLFASGLASCLSVVASLFF